MHRHVLRYLVILIVTGFCATTAQALLPKDGRDTITEGHRIYDQACAWCHGSEGKGDGPSGWSIGRYAAPRPRDFTAESYKFRSTPSGELPTDQDLFRTITQGIPGFMPSYRSLNEQERWQVIAYLKSLNPAFEQEREEPERHHVEDEVHQVAMHEAVRDDRVIDTPALCVVRPENEAIHQLGRGKERHEAHDDRRDENQQCDAHGRDDLSRG